MSFINTLKKMFCPENSSNEIDKRYDNHDFDIIHFYESEIRKMKKRAKHYRDQREEYERQVKELQENISLREAMLDANHSICGMKGINGHA